MKQTIIIVSIVVIFLSGCVERYYVCVNSMIDPSAEIKKNYVLIPDPASHEMDGESLLFRECARYVDEVLASKGFVKIDVVDVEQLSKLPLSDYPYTIFLGYNVKFSQKQGYSISGQSHKFDYFDTFSAAITPYTDTTATSSLSLRALDLAKIVRTGGSITFSEGKYNLVGGDWAWSWVTVAITPDSSGDLRRVFPILLAAMKPYIATNIGKMVEIRLAEDNKRVIEIKELLNKK